MKKKLYQNPEMEVVKLNNRQTLLSGSCSPECGTHGGGGSEEY